LPKGKKRRVVVLLEKNPIFWSCPLSNKWLVDVVDTSFLVHSYTAAAERMGYTFVQTEITDIDRAAAAYTQKHFSSAYVPSSEHLALKQKIKVFKGGTFVKTMAGDFKFDDVIFMGHHQTADLVWKMGAIGKNAEGKPTTWAAVSPQFGHYSKSGHIANRMSRSMSTYIAQQSKGKEMRLVTDDNFRRQELWQVDLQWYGNMVKDFTGG
jgi:hypothetical protein